MKPHIPTVHIFMANDKVLLYEHRMLMAHFPSS